MQFTLLAESMPDPAFTNNAIVLIVLALSAAAHLATVARGWMPQKRNVIIDSEGATKSELHGLQQKLKELSEAQSKDRDTMVHDSDERRRAIYAKIEDLRREVKSDSEHLNASIVSVRESVASLKTSAETAATGINSLSSKIDTLLQRK